MNQKDQSLSWVRAVAGRSPHRAPVAAWALALACAAHADPPPISIYGTGSDANSGATFSLNTTISSTSTVQLSSGVLLSGTGPTVINGALQYNQADSLLTITNLLSGTGSLTLMNTGTLKLTAPTVGSLIPLNMTVNANSGHLTTTESPAGSLTGVFQFGVSGTGTLNVAGGRVSAHSVHAGVNSTGVGTINVSSGTLALRQSLLIGGSAGGTGTLNVTGGKVTGVTGSGFAEGMTIGFKVASGVNSVGTANISNGGEVHVAGNSSHLAEGDGSTGVINVTGTGSYLKTGQFVIGAGNNTSGTINITDGARVDMLSNISVGGPGNFSATDSNNRSALVIISGGSMQTRGAAIGFTGSGTSSMVVNNNGQLLINGLGSTESTGILQIGGSGSAKASLDISDGGYVVVTASLKRGGAGTLNLNQGGTLQIGGVGGNLSLWTIATTGATGSGSNGVLEGDLDFAGTLKFAQNGSSSYNGVLSGSGDLVKTGTGTVLLGGNNSYTGGTTLTSGTLGLNSANAIGTTGTITFDGGVLQATSYNTTDYSPRFSKADGQKYAIDSNGQTLTLAGDLTSVGGSFRKVGSGTVNLTGANAFASGTIQGGVLIGSASSLATSGNFDIATGCELRMDVASSLSTWGGGLTGSGTFTKTGAGTLVMTSSGGSGSGTLAIDGGAVRGDTSSIKRQVKIGAGCTLIFDQTFSGTYTRNLSGDGSVLLSNTGTVTLTGTSSYTGGTTVAYGRLIGRTTNLKGSIVNNGTVEFAQSSTGTYAGDMSGSGSLVKSATGALTLTGSNSYSGGTEVEAGTLIGNTTSLSSAIRIYASGTVRYEQTSDGIYAGQLLGSGKFEKTGGGALTLSGSNGTYIGTATVFSGSLIGTTTSLPGKIINNGQVEFAQAGNGTYSGDLSGNGLVNKSGAGTVILSGSNTYTGATTISGGTLVVDGDSSAANGNVTVQNGARLGGSGTVGGLVTVDAGGTLAPGDSPGLLTLAGGLTLSAGSTFSWELAANTALVSDRGTLYDGVDITGGALTIGTGVISVLVFNGQGSTVDWSHGFWATDRSWMVLGAGSATGLPDDIQLTKDAFLKDLGDVRSQAKFGWSKQGNDLYLNYYAPVPEPATVCSLVAFTAAGLAVRILRRRQS